MSEGETRLEFRGHEGLAWRGGSRNEEQEPRIKISQEKHSFQCPLLWSQDVQFLAEVYTMLRYSNQEVPLSHMEKLRLITRDTEPKDEWRLSSNADANGNAQPSSLAAKGYRSVHPNLPSDKPQVGMCPGRGGHQ
ncbi:hypothetical protein QTO34_005984 [Cnephaeus nilssonii]|uniref:Uncharacterized protein n=1 Tax=Cnephaeus nilssonii TaxID=3371016 RepID=A0AA40LJ27_CNENI|nr:hypothetical protein QTO34_005984 [Eptesicus nilssonii]